jgi:predicted dehydrogenase
MDKRVRVGIIGMGNMGRFHANYIVKGKVPGLELVAVSDTNKAALDWVKKELGPEIKTYSSNNRFFEDPDLDAVIIATTHYSHPELAIKAFERGLHVLLEKPAGVYTRQVSEMNKVAARTDKKFAIMFCMRAKPIYQKVKELLSSGELGHLKRINWIITTPYRPQSYYDSGGWRATWAGEGGGVLLNQVPHQLDLWQWICGMPIRLRSFCYFGKYHDIEVEDDLTVFMEYKDGATGVFIASTGETPGTDRFEIIGEEGKIVVENEQLKFWKLRIPEREFNKNFRGGFGEPEAWECQVPIGNIEENMHIETCRSWIRAIKEGTPLLTPGEEGINMVHLANAIHLSSWLDEAVSIPIDEGLFYEKLQEKVKESNYIEEENNSVYFEADKSF